MDYEYLQTLGNSRVEAAAPAARAFSESFWMFAVEATDYSQKSLESGSPFIDKLRRGQILGERHAD